MEQQQFKVSFSVGTKLLVSVVLLLFIVIVFLNISSIFLFKQDKLAYTYQSQSNAALLVGREFVVTAKHALDTLRISLVTVDPRLPVTSAQSQTLQSIIDNQTELLLGSVQMVNLTTGASKVHSIISKTKEIKDLGMNLDNYKLDPSWLVKFLPELTKNSYIFKNLSQMKGLPILAVLFADTKLKSNSGELPVAFGLISLKQFSTEVDSLGITVATINGWVLYDSDPAVQYSHDNISGNPLFQTAVGSQISTGAKEYEYKNNHYLGSYILPGLNLVVLTKTEWQKVMKSTYVLIEKFFLLGSMAVGAAVVFAILFSKTLTAPIGRLYDATKEVAKGNFLFQLDEKGRDELSALSKSFNVMAQKINELVKESVDKANLENELAIASTVQQTLIPPEEFHARWIQIHSYYQSASECGGDWWGFFGVGNKIAIMISDATGHGLPSALMTASARSCFSVMHKLAQEDPDFSFSPSAMLSYANRVIFDVSLGKIMMTFFIGVIDFEEKTLTYSSAAHNPPWLFKKEGDSYTLKSLIAVGQRLGEVRECSSFEEKTLSVNPSDILFLYTDGLTEGKDKKGDMYGKKRVREIVEKTLKDGTQAVIKTLVQDFLKFNDGKSLDDDITIAAAMLLDVDTSDRTRV